MKASLFSIILLALTAICSTETQAQVRTFDELTSLIQQKNISSIEELLPHLDTELRSNYSLVFDSRSPIEASFKKPRVILWSKDSDFMLGFAGDQNLRGGNQLEVIEFKKAEKKFEFSQVEFPKNHLEKTVFKKQEASCLACHSSLRKISGQGLFAEAHPIWDTYPDWPGVYGSSHKARVWKGRFFGSSDAPDVKKLNDEFKAFKQEALKTPSRYSQLPKLENQSLDRLATINSNVGTKLLVRQNEKIAHTLYHHPEYPKYEKAIRKIFNLLPEDREFLAEEQFIESLSKEDQELYRKQKESIQDQITKEMDDYYLKKTERFNQIAGLSGKKAVQPSTTNHLFSKRYLVNLEHQYRYPNLTRFKFVLDRMGIDPSIITLVRENGVLATAQGQGDLAHFMTQINRMKKANVPTDCANQVLNTLVNPSSLPK